MVLVPGLGFGAIHLGMDREVAAGLLGGPREFVRDRLMCQGPGVFLDADGEGRITFIEFYGRKTALEFDGLDLWRVRSILELIERGHPAKVYPGRSSIHLDDLGLALYLEEGRITSVSVFQEGAYEGLNLPTPELVTRRADVPAWLEAAARRSSDRPSSSG